MVENFTMRIKRLLLKKEIGDEFYNEMKKLVATVVKHLNYSDLILDAFGNFEDGIEELANELVIHFIKKKEKFIELIDQYLSETNFSLETTDRRIYGYIKVVTENIIIDSLKREKTLAKDSSRLKMETLSLDNDELNGNKYERIFSIHLENLSENPIDELRADFIVDLFKSEFNTEQLCYFLYKKGYNKEILLQDKSDDAKYKIIQRTKEKLKMLVTKYDISPSELKISIQKFMSNVCEKICHNN
ncbi:MAG: hypothetical protein ABDH59_05375 [Fervidobacterium sp.]